MPHPQGHATLAEFVAKNGPEQGAWGELKSYMTSLLKAWWGDHATEENDFCFGHLPRINGDHSVYPTMLRMIEGKCRGYFLVGENPAVGNANARIQREALASLDWLVVRDTQEIESAAFWYDSPEIDAGLTRPEDIGTEVFFLPAAAHTEKDGCFTNTQRLLQWREKAVEPPGDCRSDLHWIFDLGQRIRRKLRGLDRPARPADPRAHVELPDGGPARRAARGRRPAGDRRPARRRDVRRPLPGAQGRRLDDLRVVAARRDLQGRHEPARAAQAAHRAGLGRARVGVGVAGRHAPALQPRLGRPAGPAVVGAQALRLVGRRSRAAGPASTTRTSRRTSRPTSSPTRTPRAWRRSAAARRSSPTRTGSGGSGRRRASSTGRCRRTTSRTSRRSPTRSTPRARTRCARRSTARTTATTRATASPGPRCSRTS